MRQEVVLARLAKEPSHGYQLRARLREALGPPGDGMNAGQIYVTLTRLEKAALADEPTGNLDSEATLDVLRLFDRLHMVGQTLIIVTHDSRIAATADRLISMRDGAFVDETRLSGGTRGNLGALAGLDG